MDLNKKRDLILIIVILIAVILGIILEFTIVSKQTIGDIGIWEPVILTPESMSAFLSSLSIVNDLPKSSNININFGDKEYSITNGEVVEGSSENPDIIINLPEEYIEKIGLNPCGALREALEKGELGIETSLSNTKLLLKYKGLLKHRDCLGI